MWLLWKSELGWGIYTQEIYSTCLGRSLRGHGGSGGGGEIFLDSTGPVSIILGRTVSQNMQVSLVWDLQALVSLHVGLLQCSSYSFQIGHLTSVQTLEFRWLVFMRNEEVDNEWEQRRPGSFPALEEQESGSFQRADRTKQTRGQLGDENTVSCWLMFPHFASVITSAVQGPLWQSHRHNNAAYDNALLCGAIIFRMGAGCLHTISELFWGMLQPSFVTFSFSFLLLTGAGLVLVLVSDLGD